MKGLTTAPLTIWVAAEFYSHPAVLKLMADGHRIVNMNHKLSTATAQTPEPDLILHPAAHFWTSDFWDYLPAAVTAARRRQREGRRETK